MKSNIPNEWLEPLVIENIEKLNHEATKDFVTIEKKVYDTLLQNNLNLMNKVDTLEKELKMGERKTEDRWFNRRK